MDILKEISTYLQRGDDAKVSELTTQAIDEKLNPEDILNIGLVAGMDIIGEKFRVHEIFLPQVLLAARAMYAGMDLLKPLFLKIGMPSIGKIVLGTVQGDLHDIGKNLVGIMLKGAGFEIIDLGKDVPAEEFVDTAVREGADIIGMSTLLTTTMPVMTQVIELLGERCLDNRIKTMVGGAPVSKKMAEEMGASAYAYDAANAVECAKKLIG